ncbi:hypothetical protein [Lewinella sp. IMCC34183]|uniref:hypothetical protein n=1 Tax=Lewinella sp. IMCC34183 TaxID=2248762 RepID=UPI000E24F310|nr:hypothetical protein [Lewinella sp. IMCC34183]
MRVRNTPTLALSVAGLGITVIARLFTFVTTGPEAGIGAITGVGLGLLLVGVIINRRGMATPHHR